MATSRTFMQVTPTPSSAGSVLPFTFTWLPSLQLSTCLGLRFRRLPEWAATASRGCSSLGFSAGQNPRSCLSLRAAYCHQPERSFRGTSVQLHSDD